MGTCVHRARVQPSKYPKSTAVDLSDTSEIYNDMLFTLSHQLFHHLPQGCCLFPIHNSTTAFDNSFIRPRAYCQVKVHNFSQSQPFALAVDADFFFI
jgi:hypothetical protein